MPDEAWGIISSSYIIAYQRVDDGSLKYLGMDDLGATDDAGHPLVAMDGTWVHVAGRPCCYQAKGSRLTEEGTIFTGTTKALVNGVESTIYIEWDPITEESGDAVEGHVTGYNETQLDDVLSFVGGISPELTSLLTDGKAMRQLQPGDRVEFLFDYYDDAGELVRGNVADVPLTVSSQERIVVSDQQLPTGNVVFGGVYTDVYQRTMSTEKVEATIE